MTKLEQTQNIKRVTLVTDAWFPQINGVVTTLSSLVKELEKQGIEVDVIQPNDYPNFPLPTYKEIRLVWNFSGIKERILDFSPDAIHIATEGSLGWHIRKWAIKWQLPFTSGYHTRYPEYIRARLPIPESWSYALFRRFHSKAQRTLVPGESIRIELQNKGFKNLHLMTRGVNTEIFNPQRAAECSEFNELKKPIQLYVGRIAPEKNIEIFLQLENSGTKVIIGSGPDADKLCKQYPQAKFLGAKKGAELAACYAAADVFVFPSLTDTFGVVNIEAISCGTPVAAFNVTGPKDIITPNINGVVADDLGDAIQQALSINNPDIHLSIPQFSWSHSAQQFLNVLCPIDSEKWQKLSK